MENKINLAELLKNCPKGMELDCTAYEGIVTLAEVTNSESYPIRVNISYDNDKFAFKTLSKYGQTDGTTFNKCVIFPKGKTTWEGFVPPYQFKDEDKIHLWTIQDAKDGDVIFYDDGWTCIFKCIHDYGIWYSSYCFITDEGEFHTGYERHAVDSKINGNAHLATKEQCNLLFQKIKEAGYHWNAETKTLEKLIELKEDTNDKIVMSDIYFDREYYADEVELHLNNYEIKIRDGKTYAIFKNQETKILKPKFKVGDRIKHKCEKFRDERTITSYGKGGYWTSVNDWIDYNDQDNWELVPNKFDITTLKPFDKVLVRTDNKHRWSIQFFERLNNVLKDSFVCMGGVRFHQCIPYEGNEYLLKTTEDCNDFYKTWEK